jgi:hypothetical protein
MKDNVRTDHSLDLTTFHSIAMLPAGYAALLCLLLTVFLFPHLFAQSEKLVWLKAPNGRAYTTTCTSNHCEIQETAHALDLADPQYVHDRNQERKVFCKAQQLKHKACSLAFRREEMIQNLLLADGIVSRAGAMPTMTRRQAELLVDDIQEAGSH